MDKIKKLKELVNIKSLVREVLEKNEDARKDDNILFYKVVEAELPDVACKSFKYVMEHATYYGISMHSIIRFRRMVQKEHPELICEETADEREQNQDVFNRMCSDWRQHVPFID